MSKQRVVIIDTGCANLTSVAMACQRLGFTPTISANDADIRHAHKLILPGVGTAAAAMANLQQRELREVIRAVTQPLLGICLGMQLLAEASEENRANPLPINTLALMPGRVRLLAATPLRLPHMGWNRIHYTAPHPLLNGIPTGSYCYFVHSYALAVNENTLASCHYGQPFSALVARDNFFGAQFHPERSGAVGARLLNNFLEM